MDQALFAKVAEIAWKQKELFPNILLRMGTFHTICNALSILGKRFRDAGLKDICIEAGIVVRGPSMVSLMVNTTIVLSESTSTFMKP